MPCARGQQTGFLVWSFTLTDPGIQVAVLIGNVFAGLLASLGHGSTVHPGDRGDRVAFYCPLPSVPSPVQFSS